MVIRDGDDRRQEEYLRKSTPDLARPQVTGLKVASDNKQPIIGRKFTWIAN